ncbi:MAG: FCD domain-containing protein [Eubacteriales bacterium]
MHKPIIRVSLQSEIIKYIQRYIEENNLMEGDKLPSQGEFIEMMQVSRTALREAVKTLEAEGIIEVKNGKGIFVGNKEFQKKKIQSILGFELEKEKLIEILEARRAMEKQLLVMAVEKATTEELDELESVLIVLMEKYHANTQNHEDDKRFHQLIYSMCHNQVYQNLLNILEAYSSTLWEYPLDMTEPFRDSMPFHVDLYEALRERNLENAQRVNDILLDRVLEDISKSLQGHT